MDAESSQDLHSAHLRSRRANDTFQSKDLRTKRMEHGGSSPSLNPEAGEDQCPSLNTVSREMTSLLFCI